MAKALVAVIAVKFNERSTSNGIICWWQTMPANDGVLGNAVSAVAAPPLDTTQSTTSADTARLQPGWPCAHTEDSGNETVEKPVTTPMNANSGMPVPCAWNVDPVQGRLVAVGVLLPPELGHPGAVALAVAAQVDT